MGLAASVVAFVSAVLLNANGQENAPSAVLAAAFVSGIAVATIGVAKGR